jgi:hypothetical protein
MRETVSFETRACAASEAVYWARWLGGTSFNLSAFLETTSAFWICTPGTMPQIESPIPVLHTLSQRQATPVQTG